MPLVNAKEMLTKAKAGHYAVGQFNINNLESVSYTHLKRAKSWKNRKWIRSTEASRSSRI